MSSDQNPSEIDIVVAVLESTRAQLSQATKLVAELDGLLTIERRRSAALSEELEQLKSKDTEKSPSGKADDES